MFPQESRGGVLIVGNRLSSQPAFPSQVVDELFQQQLDWSSGRRWWWLRQHVDPPQVSQQRRQPSQGQPREIGISGTPVNEESLNVGQVEIAQVYTVFIQP